jgi:integrase
MKSFKQDALDYHRTGRKGKIDVVPTKPCRTHADLSLAHTPGVAEPCREIERSPELSFEYTARGNLVAIVPNGTRVLGLGNIGALAGKPVIGAKEPYKTIVALAWATGLRAGELLGLSVSDLDFQREVIQPRKQADDHTRRLRELKTRKSSRQL